MKLTFASKTDIGRVRKMNQDSLDIIELPGNKTLFVVADGMGGHAGGEVASQMAVEAFRLSPTLNDLSESITNTFIQANRAVKELQQQKPELKGMGTTCVVLYVDDDNAVIGHVGDSRIYRLRNGRLTQLTADHSLVQEYVRQGSMSPSEARASRFRNVITRAIGIEDKISPEVRTIPLEDGDSFLLCTDGLTGMVADSIIERVLLSALDAQSACKTLVSLALRGGGDDNISVVVVRAGNFIPAGPMDESKFEETQVEAEEEALKADQYSQTGRSASPAFVLLIVLCLLLTTLLAGVVLTHYNFISSWPFLQDRNSIQRTIPTPPISNATENRYSAAVRIGKENLRPTISVDKSGDIYAATIGGKVVRISPDGKVSVVPSREITLSQTGDTPAGWAADSRGNLFIIAHQAKVIYKYRPDGTRCDIIGKGKLQDPRSVRIDGADNLYVIDGTKLIFFKAEAISAAR